MGFPKPRTVGYPARSSRLPAVILLDWYQRFRSSAGLVFPRRPCPVRGSGVYPRDLVFSLKLLLEKCKLPMKLAEDRRP